MTSARYMALGLLTLLLVGCASSEVQLPRCDGKHKRPANPYGSVLPGAAQPGPAISPARAPGTPLAAYGRSYLACGSGRS